MKDSAEDVLKFPTEYTFKAFGPEGDRFIAEVKRAVSVVLPVSEHSLKIRPSSGGKYVSISILLWLESRDQLIAIYKQLQSVQEIKYIL